MATNQHDSLARQLHGSAFLSLEHMLYMASAVLLPVVLAGGLAHAVELWGQRSDTATIMSAKNTIIANANGVEAAMWAAALVIVGVFAVVLHRRTSAEIAKRPGYTRRLAWKLPVYGALAVTLGLKLIADVVMLAVFLQSLSLIGVKNADIGALYMGQFLPALMAALLFGSTAWYLAKLAKGSDRSAAFSSFGLLASLLLATALFVTSTVQLHNNTSDNAYPPIPAYGGTRDLYQ